MANLVKNLSTVLNITQLEGQEREDSIKLVKNLATLGKTLSVVAEDTEIYHKFIELMLKNRILKSISGPIRPYDYRHFNDRDTDAETFKQNFIRDVFSWLERGKTEEKPDFADDFASCLYGQLNEDHFEPENNKLCTLMGPKLREEWADFIKYLVSSLVARKTPLPIRMVRNELSDAFSKLAVLTIARVESQDISALITELLDSHEIEDDYDENEKDERLSKLVKAFLKAASESKSSMSLAAEIVNKIRSK